jgi:hypothetical protein
MTTEFKGEPVARVHYITSSKEHGGAHIEVYGAGKHTITAKTERYRGNLVERWIADDEDHRVRLCASSECEAYIRQSDNGTIYQCPPCLELARLRRAYEVKFSKRIKLFASAARQAMGGIRKARGEDAVHMKLGRYCGGGSYSEREFIREEKTRRLEALRVVALQFNMRLGKVKDSELGDEGQDSECYRVTMVEHNPFLTVFFEGF